MNMTHTLTRHREIRAWVTANSGLPAIRRTPNAFGESRPRLALRFSRPSPATSSMPPLDEGLSPVSWAAWLAELDRQRLAVRITDPGKPQYEFVELRDLN